jgi:hypothetical protein
MDRHTRRKVEAKYIAPIEEAELAVRLAEARCGLRRPTGSTALQALDAMEEEDRVSWRRAAIAAMEYWRECIENANRPS